MVASTCLRSFRLHGDQAYLLPDLLLPRLPLVIGNTSCYRDYLLLLETPLVIETTSCYRKHLLLSRLPLVIGNTSCYRDYLLLSETPLVIETTLLLSETPLVIETTSCYRKHLLLSKGIFVRLRASYRGGVVASVVIFNEAFANGRDCCRGEKIAGKIYHLCLLKVNNSGSLFKGLIKP